MESEERPFDVMVAGHLCLDIIPKFATDATSLNDLLRPGQLIEVSEAAISTGGAVSNTGIVLKVLGNNVCFSARVGEDAFGKMTLDILSSRGNSEGIRVVPEQASSYTVVLAPPKIDRMFLHNPGTNNSFGPEDLRPELLTKCRLFHFGYPPLMRRMYENEGENLKRIFQTAKECGATTSCDMALPDPNSPAGKAPWRKILENVLPFVDVFVPSIEEAFYMIEPTEFLRRKEEQKGGELIDVLTPDEYSRIADTLLSMGCKMTTLKAGHRGFYLKTSSLKHLEGMGAASPKNLPIWGNRELWQPAYRAEYIASATGSGDSAIAGFLTGLMKGLTPEMTLHCAACVGWQNLQALDAISGVRSWEYTLETVRKGLPLLDAHIHAPGWYYSQEHGIWAGPKDPLNKN